MSIDTQNTPEMNAAIDSEMNRIIATSCAKHGIHPSQLDAGSIADARRTAAEMVLRDQARQANPMFTELEQRNEKIRLLEMQVDALKGARANSGNDRQPAMTVDVARKKLGELEWSHRMSEAQRLQAIGINPAEVTAETKQTIMDIFGPHSDHRRASDLMKTDALRYRTLREIGRCLKMI
jgi:hypothetical protein